MSGSNEAPPYSPHRALISQTAMRRSGSDSTGTAWRSHPHRGHSDGDVPESEPISPALLANVREEEDTPQHDSTWRDFLQQIPPGDDEFVRRQMAIRRAAVVMQDRRKRLSESWSVSSSTGRRRSSTPLSPGPSTFRRDLDGRLSPISATGHRRAGSAALVPETVESSRFERPLPPRPALQPSSSDTETSNMSAGTHTKPRWQPDVEVEVCPICGRQFSFWYRKHHCRKCGRVVCNYCSPHRITIPRQFIVEPPDIEGDHKDQEEAERVDRHNDTAAGPEGQTVQSEPATDALNPGLGGGREVRLCNPCVPDPNPLPPPDYSSLGSPTSTSFPPQHFLRPPSHEHPHPGQRWTPGQDSTVYPGVYLAHDRNLARRSLPYPAIPQPYQGDQDGRVPSRSRAFTGPVHPHRGSSSLQRELPPRPDGSFSSPLSSSFVSLPVTEAPYSHADNPQQQHNPLSPSRAHHRSHASAGAIPPHIAQQVLTSPPRASGSCPPISPLPEEDECPVCHLELPPLGPDGSEAEREAHITSCISDNFSSSLPRTLRSASESAVPASAVMNYPGVEAAPSTGLVASSFDSSVGVMRQRAESSQQRRRPPGMLVYHATEKDCVGQDNVPQECVICFEEFLEGDEMGRLECLCKFHRKCIRQWWEKKGVGACPVHHQGTM